MSLLFVLEGIPRTDVCLFHTSACKCRYAKTYTGGTMPPLHYEGVPGKNGQSPMMPPVQMDMPAMVAHPPVTGSDDGGSMHTAPMPLSDGCTNDDGMQPHSTVSSDAGKSSLLKGGEHKVCDALRLAQVGSSLTEQHASPAKPMRGCMNSSRCILAKLYAVLQVCKNCATDCTPFWRKDKNDQLPLCNACGLYAAKNGSMRPASLWRQEEGISPLPRPPAAVGSDDVTMDVLLQGGCPASAPLPSLHPSGPTSTGPSEALSDPLHPTTGTDGATAAPKSAAGAAKASSPRSGVQPAPTTPAEAQPTSAATAPAASASTAPIAVPSGPPAQVSNSALRPATAGHGTSESFGLPPLNKPSANSQAPDNAKSTVSQSAPLPSAVQERPTPGLCASPPVAGHPAPAIPTTMPPMPGPHVPPTNTAVRVPTPTTNVAVPSCFHNEDSMQLPSAAELLSGGLQSGGGMRAHSATMMPPAPGPTLMPSPMVAPYNARFVQLGTIGHGPQQYPIVQFAGPGGAMPQFQRPHRTRSDAQSTLPPLPPLAKSAPPMIQQPPGPFVAMPSIGVSQQRSKQIQHTTKCRRAPRQTPALSDSSPMVTSPQLTPSCTEMADVAEEPFGDDEALGDADDAAFDPAELEALFNDDIPIPLDSLQEGGCESNVFDGDTNSLGDLDCVPPSRDGAAARAHSAPDPFGFP